MKTDVLIVGGGPGGAISAMFLLREGIRPIILEQEEFPRFHIGESMTGEAGQVLRRLGLEDKMQTANYPVKHGVKVYGADGVNSWFIPVSARTQEWKLSPGTTWQVRRSDFDEMILQESKARGATVMRGKAVKALLGADGAVRGITLRHPDGRLEDIESEVVLDCSGLATFLGKPGSHRAEICRQLRQTDRLFHPCDGCSPRRWQFWRRGERQHAHLL